MGSLKLKTFSKYQKYTTIFIYNAKFVIGLQKTEFKFYCAKYSKQIWHGEIQTQFLKDLWPILNDIQMSKHIFGMLKVFSVPGFP